MLLYQSRLMIQKVLNLEKSSWNSWKVESPYFFIRVTADDFSKTPYFFFKVVKCGQKKNSKLAKKKKKFKKKIKMAKRSRNLLVYRNMNLAYWFSVANFGPLQQQHEYLSISRRAGGRGAYGAV